jgi:glycerol-3-phosphate dehydrogenase
LPVVNLVVKKHGGGLAGSKTSRIRLGHAPFADVQEVAHFIETLKSAAAPLVLAEYQVPYLVENYGADAQSIVQHALTHGLSEGDEALILAELEYCINNEMVCTLADFFVRRTGLIYFDIARVKRRLQVVARRCEGLLGWSPTRTATELSLVEEWIRHAGNFD